MSARCFLALLLMASAASASEPTSCPGETRGLVISGGGVRGAYQIGAMWYLVNVLGCDFKHYYGTSTGAATAAILAQAKNHDDLKRKVDVLKTEYLGLKTKKDIVRGRFLGKLRAFVLPWWLGGIDGLYTLKPFQDRIAPHLPADVPPSDRLTVTVTSLQAGPLDPAIHRFENPRDLVIASASIPLAITPRLARLWVTGHAAGFVDNYISVRIRAIAGMSDPECLLLLPNGRTLNCLQLKQDVSTQVSHSHFSINGLTRPGEPSATYSTEVLLMLFGLKEQDRKLIKDAVAAFKKNPSGAPKLEFTTRHQLVDGGVTENVPLGRVIKADESGERLDSLFILLAGRSSPLMSNPRSVHGAGNVAAASFELMWSAYQTASVESTMRFVEFYQIFCANVETEAQMSTWLKSLRTAIGSNAFEKIASGLPKSPISIDRDGNWDGIWGCDDRKWKQWRTIVVNPVQTDLTETLDFKPEQLRSAMVVGCKEAAWSVVMSDPRREILVPEDERQPPPGIELCNAVTFGGKALPKI